MTRTEPSPAYVHAYMHAFIFDAAYLPQLARARNSEASAADVVQGSVRPRAGADLRGGVQRLRHSRGWETGKPEGRWAGLTVAALVSSGSKGLFFSLSATPLWSHARVGLAAS